MQMEARPLWIREVSGFNDGIAIQGDPSHWLKTPVDSVQAVPAAGGQLLTVVTWRNIQNPGQREVATNEMGHPV